MTEDKILEQVRNLLARAEHPNTPEPERDLCFSRANKMMIRHAIDEAVLRAGQTAQERKAPTSKRFDYINQTTEFAPYFRTMIHEIARSARCKAVTFAQTPDGTRAVAVVGFSEDVAWVEMLYTSCYLGFLSALDPRWNDGLDFDANIYAFKKAGFSWETIFLHMSASCVRRNIALPCNNPSKSDGRTGDGGYMIRAYKREARRLGDDQQVKTARHDAYRASFAQAFAYRISSRLEAMVADNAAATTEAGSGTELALRDSMDQVVDLFEELFPHLSRATRAEQQARLDASTAARAAAHQKMLDDMTPRQREQYLERAERERQKQAAKDARYWAKQERQGYIAGDSDGFAAGANAADKVSMSRATGVGAEDRAALR